MFWKDCQSFHFLARCGGKAAYTSTVKLLKSCLNYYELCPLLAFVCSQAFGIEKYSPPQKHLTCAKFAVWNGIRKDICIMEVVSWNSSASIQSNLNSNVSYQIIFTYLKKPNITEHSKSRKKYKHISRGMVKKKFLLYNRSV